MLNTFKGPNMSEDSKKISEENSIEETIQEETKVIENEEQQASIKCSF